MAEVSLGHLPAAAGEERRVDVQFEVQSQPPLRLGLTAGAQHAHQSLGRGEVCRLRLVPQPVPARFRGGIG